MEKKDPSSEAAEPRTWSRRQLLKAGGALGVGLATAASAGSRAEARKASETSSPPLRNRVEDIGGPNKADYEARIEKARRAVVDHGFDALFVEAGTSLSYFSGVSWWPSERVFGLLIPRKGEIAYVSPAFEEGRARERITVGTDVRTWQEDESPYAQVHGILKERGLTTSRLAVDPEARLFVFDGLANELSATRVLEGSGVINACRGRKDEKELALMRRANEITQAAIFHAASRLEEGMTQRQLAQAVQDAHVAQGAEPGWALVLFGPNAAYPHGTDASYTLKKGDLVLMDCGTEVHGYQSDITRTYCFGKAPTDRQLQVWEVVRQAQEAAFRRIRPGVHAGEIDRTARAVIEKAGFGSGYSAFTHRLGHGIGMEGHEWPYLVRGNPLPLAPGMTFSNEPGIYLVGDIGVRIEDILCVTNEGCQYLSEPVTELQVVGA
ncbi:MAG: M24 family metallopeptidase [Acidobacteria bacterium]|nr:M24 family metallopeptidase [Acidobacteriota bacterium]